MQAPWSVIDLFTDIDDKVNTFNTMFDNILNQHASIKAIKVKGKPNPCVDENIRALMKTRDRWHKYAKRTNDPLAWSAYRNLRGEVKREIKIGRTGICIKSD